MPQHAGLIDPAADRLREAEALLAISTTVNSTLDVREALRRVCREVAILLGADTAAAYRHTGADQLVPIAGYHVPKDLVATLLSAPLPLRERRFYTPIWRERRPVMSSDVSADPRFDHDLFRRFPHQSGLMLPLVLDDRVEGAFYLVWWTERRELSAREHELIEHIVAQVAVLLRNADRFEQAERERLHLETMYQLAARLAATQDTEQLLSLIVDEAAAMLGAEAAGFRLLEGGALVIGARTASAAALMKRPELAVGAGLSGFVVVQGEPVAVEDLEGDARFAAEDRKAVLAQGFRGFLGVPLRLHGRVIGALLVFTRHRRVFLAEDVSVLLALADQAAVAIHKSRLLRVAEDARAVVERLYRVAVSITASSGRAERLQAFTQGVHDAVGFDRISVLLVSEDGRHLELAAAFGEKEDAPPATIPLTPAAGVLYQVVERCRPIAVLDDDALAGIPPLDPAYTTHPYFRARRFVVAPLVVRGRAIGVGIADNKRSRRPIPAASVEPLSLLCQQLATALEETRLQAESHARAQEATRLYEEMRAQQARLSQILDSTSDGIVLVGPGGGIDAANPRAAELLGVAPDQMIGRDLAELAAEADAATTALAALRDLGGDVDREVEGDLVLRSRGRVLHWVARPTRTAAGARFGVTLTLRDATQEREVSRMKSDFVSFVTHQLRTPLNGIKWMLELAAQEPDVPAGAASYVQDAGDAAARLIKLVNDLLDVSKLERGKFQPERRAVQLGVLTRAVRDEMSVLASDRDLRLTVEGDADVQPVVADPLLLRQVLLNLLSNAIKYTERGGRIAVEMAREGACARWSITDNGIGVPEPSRPKLFEKFYRAENVGAMETEGTGLGLYIVRLILERLGGRIWFEPAPDGGSTFAFTLPLASARRGRS